jgi:hypothetical protein
VREKQVEGLANLFDNGVCAPDVVEVDVDLTGPVQHVGRPSRSDHRRQHHANEDRDKGDRGDIGNERTRDVRDRERLVVPHERPQQEGNGDGQEHDRQAGESPLSDPFPGPPDIGPVGDHASVGKCVEAGIGHRCSTRVAVDRRAKARR